MIPSRRWLVLLALVCALELVTHSGSRNGFLESSRPLYSANDLLPAHGYVSWAGTVPVLHDADGVFTVTALFLGSRDAANTGILDRRAAYAYLASLTVPWAGPYGGYLVLNLAFWWAAAAAAYVLVARRWGDAALARATSLLVAAGHGFVFMAGVPMSYLAAYACVALLLALGEGLDAFRRPRLGVWLLLGWGAGVAATIYFSHVVLLLFWWLYGLRRVPWRYLLAATGLALGISTAWELYGRGLVGLEFSTDNSSLIGQAVGAWLEHLQRPWAEVLTYFRGGPLAGAAATRETLLGAFALPWWALAAAGLVHSGREDREWVAAVVVAALVPTIVLLALLPLPRLAYYMYPAVYVLAARGALRLARGAATLGAGGGARISRTAGAVTLGLTLGGLILTTNLDLFGYQALNARFHFSATAAAAR